MSFAIFAIGAIILNFTAFGRAVYAIGDNETAAASTGINVTLTKIKVFALSALMASAAGILMCIRLKLGQSSIGLNQMFPVVTAIVLGGGSLYGGTQCFRRCSGLYRAYKLADTDGRRHISARRYPGCHYHCCRHAYHRAYA